MNHSPEVTDSVVERSLSADPLLAILVPDDQVGVDVIRSVQCRIRPLVGTVVALRVDQSDLAVIRQRSQLHPGLVVTLDVRVPVFDPVDRPVSGLVRPVRKSVRKKFKLGLAPTT